MCISWIRAVLSCGTMRQWSARPHRRDFAAVAAGETGGDQPDFAGGDQGSAHVWRMAGGGEADQHVARPAQRLDLAGEDPDKAEVVACRSQGRAVGGEGDRRQAAARRLVADREFGGDMLGVGGAAAIAAEEELAPGPEHRYHRLGERRRGREQRTRALKGGAVVVIEAVEEDRRGRSGRRQGGFVFRGKILRKTVLCAMDASVIDRLAQARVVVVGDVLLDRFVEGKVGRVSPEAPVAVLNHQSERALLGGAGNVAANLVAYGAHTILIGIAGDDPAAAELRALCDGERPASIAGSSPTRRGRPRSRPAISAAGTSCSASMPRMPRRSAMTPPARCWRRPKRRWPGGSPRPLRLCQGRPRRGTTIPALIAAARARGIPVVVDPKKTDAAIFAGATLLKPNTRETARFAGMAIESDADAEEAGARVLDKVAVDAILITRGERGMTLCRRGEPPLHVAAETHRVFDVTGAGDTVVATLAAALAAGLSLADAVRLANAAAGVAVTKPGTATVSPAELKQALGVASAANVMTAAAARAQVAAWQRQGLKVGFTNGCFDLLHRGHLHSLDQAARRVDRLVVGVNTDASTARLKGPGRPVQDLDTRTAVLAALKFVDLVVPFDEDTPEALIGTIVPDVLFKGADYAEADVVGGDFVKANGGRVELLPLLPGYSTTATVGRIRSGDAEPRD